LSPLAAHLDRCDIVVEVTETAFITHLERAGEVLQELRSRGFKVALDDFGSGYSSLRYLANMPIDLVKFDITLIRSLIGGTAQSGLVEDLARLILKAGYQIVAEGVETEGIGRRVASLGCRYGQGLLYGWPQPECLPPTELPPAPLRLVGGAERRVDEAR
jgi:EAL domain-containing protein (putative c-di-GMP-specific phosphodiesterase class I)